MRLQKLRIIPYTLCALCLVAIIQFFSCFENYNYAHIPKDKLQNELYRKTSPFLLKTFNVECKYDEILTSTKNNDRLELDRIYDDFLTTGIANGTYFPEQCNSVFSVAILVSYRNRQNNMDVFLPYIHNFLRKQNIHYKIYVIEQQDNKPFNKGMLYNIGAKHAIAEKFPCLILHDVDLLPLDHSNLYVCTNHPRHMSAGIDKFRYVLPYDQLVGGVMAIRSEQYVMVNGFSNRFNGWGGEDDDLFARIKAHKLNVLRFPLQMSRYNMQRHKPESKNVDRLSIMAENRREPVRSSEGYASVPYRSLQVKHHILFTLIGVMF